MSIEAIIIIASVVLDRITKNIAVESLKELGSKDFIHGLINFVYVENTGMAFGLAKGYRWVFISVTFAVILFLAVYLVVNNKNIHPLTAISLAMIIGGGIGNQYDRIAIGYVVDFIRFDFDFPIIHEFPVFNIADCFVTVASVLLIISILFFDKTIFADEKSTNNSGKNDG